MHFLEVMEIKGGPFSARLSSNKGLNSLYSTDSHRYSLTRAIGKQINFRNQYSNTPKTLFFILNILSMYKF